MLGIKKYLKIVMLLVAIMLVGCSVFRYEKKVTVMGTAINVKSGAAISTTGIYGLYFVVGLNAWDSVTVHKKVAVTGTLVKVDNREKKGNRKRKKALKKAGVSHETREVVLSLQAQRLSVDYYYYIENATWRLVE